MLTELQRKSIIYHTPITNTPQSKTKADIETGNTIEYDFTSYQVKQTIVKEQKYN